VKSVPQTKMDQALAKEKRKKDNLDKRNKKLENNSKMKRSAIKKKLFSVQKTPKSKTDESNTEVPFIEVDTNNADEECIFCNEPYKRDSRGETWIKCIQRAKWVHDLCTNVDSWKKFKCDFCQSVPIAI